MRPSLLRAAGLTAGSLGLLTSSCGGAGRAAVRADDSGLAPPQVTRASRPSGVWTPVEWLDVGELCLTDTLTPDQPLAVNVYPKGRCLSSSCTRWSENTCRVDRQGDRVVVHSRQLFEDAPPDQACTEDCGGATGATCASVDPLPAGHYTLVFGKTEIGFDVPARFASSCVGGDGTLTPVEP